MYKLHLNRRMITEFSFIPEYIKEQKADNGHKLENSRLGVCVEEDRKTKTEDILA